jgi:hypothetical protein
VNNVIGRGIVASGEHRPHKGLVDGTSVLSTAALPPPPPFRLVQYPNAGREWAWQWVFPATRFYVDRVGGVLEKTASSLGLTVHLITAPLAGPESARSIADFRPVVAMVKQNHWDGLLVVSTHVLLRSK